MNFCRKNKLWLDKAEYLEALARQHKDGAALGLVHKFVSVILQIDQLWRAFDEAPLPTVESLGQHLRDTPDGELNPLSEAATYFRLAWVKLDPSDFYGTGETSAALMLRSEIFRQLLSEVDAKLRAYAPRQS